MHSLVTLALNRVPHEPCLLARLSLSAYEPSVDGKMTLKQRVWFRLKLTKVS